MCLWTAEDKYKEKIFYTRCAPIFWLNRVTLAVLGIKLSIYWPIRMLVQVGYGVKLKCNSDVS